MIILAVLLVLLAFVYPSAGSWILIGVVVLIDVWMLFVNSRKITVKNRGGKYSPEEVRVIEKFRLFFQFPMACRSLSKFYSAVQLSVFILVPWLLYQNEYIQAVFIGLNYFVSSWFAVTLNPQFFLHNNLDKGKIKDSRKQTEYEKDMVAIDSALEKMF